MRSIDTSIGQSLMFVRFAKLTPRFVSEELVINTKDIAESYHERQMKDGKFDPALAAMIGDLRMCIWEADYVDWLATVIYRAKHSKFFSEPSKATKIQAQYLAQTISTRTGLGGASMDLEAQDPDSRVPSDLFRRACMEIDRPESAVSAAIQQCITRKTSKDSNEILKLEQTEQWGILYERILRDARYLKECIPTQFIPFQSYVRAAISEFTKAYFKWFTSRLVTTTTLFGNEFNGNGSLAQGRRKIEADRYRGEGKRELKEKKKDDKPDGLKNKENISLKV